MRVLGDDADGVAQRVQRRLAYVQPADQYGAVGHVVHPGYQHRRGGLPRPGRPDQGHHLPRLDPEGQPAQDRLGHRTVQDGHVLQGGQRHLGGARVPEHHVAELDRGGTGRYRPGVGALPDPGREVEHLEDPLEGDQRAHHVDPHVGQRGQRSVEPGQ